MTSLTPKQILKKFQSKDMLIEMAEKKGINLTKQQKKKVVDYLSAEVIKEGCKRVLSVLKGDNLKHLSDHKSIDYDKEKVEKFGSVEAAESNWFPVKNVLVEVLAERITDYGVQAFFEDHTRSTLLECCKIIDDLEDYDEEELNEFSHEDFVDGIMTNIFTFGLQNLFSSFTVPQLKTFCEDCGLTVRSGSKEVIVDCLIEQKNFRKRPKKKQSVSKLKSKPKIKKGVKQVDLMSWFLRNELEDYCREEGIKIGGSKKEIAERIIMYLSGKRTPKVMGRPRSKSPAPRSKTPTKKKSKKKSSEPTRRSRRLSAQKSREESSDSSSDSS